MGGNKCLKMDFSKLIKILGSDIIVDVLGCDNWRELILT